MPEGVSVLLPAGADKMAANAVQQVTTAATTAAIDGVKGVAASLLPGWINRLIERLFYGELSLVDPKEISAFNILYGELQLICSQTELLPPNILKCWEVFQYTESGKFYRFSEGSDLKRLAKRYATYSLSPYQIYPDFPLTLTILSNLAPVEAVWTKAIQNIGKIAFNYIARVALELSTMQNAVDRYEVARHLNTVIDKLIQRERLRQYFTNTARQALIRISEALRLFLSRPHLMREAEFIPVAIERFAFHQCQLVAQLFRSLLICVEGGNKGNLTFDYARISKGYLSQTDDTVQFHPENPLQELLTYAALFIPDLHEQYSRKLSLGALRTPLLSDIKRYLEQCSERGCKVGNVRLLHYKDPTVYLLQQKIDQNALVVWSGQKDDTLHISAKYIQRLAGWLRFHLYVADKVVNLKLLLNIEGQRWLAKGLEAQVIQLFIRQYRTLLLTEFKEDLKAIKHYLNQRVRTNTGPEYEVLMSLGDHIPKTAERLDTEGLSRLTEIEAKFTQIVDEVTGVRERFFNELGSFLVAIEKSGHQLRLPAVPPRDEPLPRHPESRRDEGSPKDSTVLDRGDPSSNFAAFRMTRGVEEKLNNVIQKGERKMTSEVIEHIKEQLTDYAKKHGYCFNLSVDAAIQMTSDKPEEQYKISSEKYVNDENHCQRVAWMYDLFADLTNESLSEADILINIEAAIKSLRTNSQKWIYFNTTKMSELITSIERTVKQGLEALPKLPPTPPRDSTLQEAEEKEETLSSHSEGDGGELQSMIQTEEVSDTSPEKPPINIVLAMFKQWEKIYSMKFIDRDKRRDFIRFLEDLCYTKQGEFKGYHMLAAKTRQHEECRDWYAQIEKGLQRSAPKELKAFANASAEMLLPKARSKARLSEIQNRKKAATKLVEESKQRVIYHVEKKLQVSSVSRFAWSERRYKRLEAFINAFNQDEKNPILASDFLEEVTRYLFQKGEDGKAIADKALDEYLSRILMVYTSKTDTQMKSFYEVFAKSLLALGANPLPWMERNHENIEGASTGYYVAADAVRLIVSQLVIRARYLGECSVILEGAIDRLIPATVAFAERLHRYVETDKAWWWGWLTKKFTNTPDGAKLERAAVYSAVLQWIAVLFNETIINNNMTSEDAYAKVRALLVEANKAYETKVPKDQLFCNLGRKPWEELKTVITTIENKVGGLGGARSSYDLVLKTMDVDEATLRERRLGHEPFAAPAQQPSLFPPANDRLGGAVPIATRGNK